MMSSRLCTRYRAGIRRVAARLGPWMLPMALAAVPVSAAAQLQPLPEASAPQVKYTVKVTSKTYGNAQQTRVVRSGQTDDYTWRMPAPGAPASVPRRCPGASGVPVDAAGAPIRQIQLRLAPVVENHVASLQLYFSGHTVQGMSTVTVNGKPLACPKTVSFTQVTRLSLPINGKTKTLTLSDGTQLSLSAHY
ncbi:MULTISPECIES: DUF6013 family protein [Mycetohabitans]|uniref:Uncharacterized protein n=1 Tax=Mycetohabitans endofungorum TaxID=417203 RepID=A0A2P5KBL9_9BURK|nr:MULTISPECIES: DUF6013 family protein [Mycetohabitans]PPB84113.1 hypothetical protein B0O95_10463 [Mycetohabitans endofungorum]